ncbi:MAG: SDR family oxidoreductase [Candidatus Eremiobacter antarcticus]
MLVSGCTGYIGGRLVPRLLAAGHSVRCMARDARRLEGRFTGAHTVAADALVPESLPAALQGMDVAYYLIHSMGGRGKDFAARDLQAAANFATAARAAGVQRIIYLGGLGNSDDRLSKHLRSRQDVGEQLRKHGPAVTEFRAAMIIGSGSASFEMTRYLTERLPVMIAPKWVSTRSQPIAIGDVLDYLIQALDRPETRGRIYEIGGADVLSYREVMLRYARLRGLKRRIIMVPFFTPQLSSYWVHLVTPIPAGIARPLIDGLHSEVVVRDDGAQRDFDVQSMPFNEAILRAFDRSQSPGPESAWFDADDVRALPGDFHGVTQGMLVDRRERKCFASPADVFKILSGLGGNRGWLYADWLWSVRGIMDVVIGGVGLRRGRRSPLDLRVGDAVDFWRVDALEPNRLLRLRAEMKLPGRAWLEFIVEPDEAGSTLQMTAYFEPRGLLGQLYWYAVMPFHNMIFGGLANAIAHRAAGTRAELPVAS